MIRLTFCNGHIVYTPRESFVNIDDLLKEIVALYNTNKIDCHKVAVSICAVDLHALDNSLEKPLSVLKFKIEGIDIVIQTVEMLNRWNIWNGL